MTNQKLVKWGRICTKTELDRTPTQKVQQRYHEAVFKCGLLRVIETGNDQRTCGWEHILL